MINIDINRINIALHGVSALVAEAAVAGLEGELKRRLGVTSVGNMAAFDIGELSIGPVHSDMVLDAAALRGIIAERLAEVILGRFESRAQAAARTTTTEGGD